MAKEFGIVPGTPVVLPWRAAFAFGEAVLEVGIRDFYHLGARRDEGDLETDIYFNEIPAVLQEQGGKHPQMAIIADPMLATGNTVITAINYLKLLNVPEESIIVVSMISAPEGVDHILSQFHRVRVIVGSHDERLNSDGYIVPGLGDFGDLYFEDLGKKAAYRWRSRGILSENAFQALITRMVSTAPV